MKQGLGLEDKTVGEGTSCYDPVICRKQAAGWAGCMGRRAAQAERTTEYWSARQDQWEGRSVIISEHAQRSPLFGSEHRGCSPPRQLATVVYRDPQIRFIDRL
jgi:hypothetical protein